MPQRELSAVEYLRLVDSGNTNERRDEEVYLPAETWGECRVATCYTINMLADGYCITHWDRGMDDED